MQRTSDRGALADRIASISADELHKAMVAAAVDALRHGAGLDLLDGLEYWRMSDITVRTVDTRARRISALREDLASATAAYRNARSNANATDNERLRADLLADAQEEAVRVAALEEELEELSVQPANGILPATFESECDYVAHGLAALLTCGEHASRELADALSRVIELGDFRRIPTSDPPQVEVEFFLLLPADGKVAKFGPITCRVRNRAYSKTLRDSGDAERARALLSGHLPAQIARGGTVAHKAATALRTLLVEQGWSLGAAGLLSRSGAAPLYAVAARVLWGQPPPQDLDPSYVDLVIATYSRPDFNWHHTHAIDCRLRQLAVDQVVAAGGRMLYAELEAALADTKVDDVRITIFSRDQTLGNSPTWYPCLRREGDWRQHSPKAGRSLAAIACPHCGGWASRVVRTPETPACLLCPDCLRMPVPTSPRFPLLYATL
jgi:hypothetical protein